MRTDITRIMLLFTDRKKVVLYSEQIERVVCYGMNRKNEKYVGE